MPELDGLKTIQLIKNELDSPEKKQPVILLHSSSDNADMHAKCDELGIRFRLTKPVKSDELYNFLCSLNQPVQAQITQSQNTTGIQQYNFNNPVTILIAEDNNFNMLLIKAVISKTFPGVKIVEAKNGKEAYMFWVIEQPDLILMDMQMPEMSGIEATLKIREQETDNQHTPIVALTAGALKEEKEKCMEAGMDEFLTKPLEPIRLVEVVRGLIGKE
jgi:CheY-like chemotaxis protein